MTYSLKLDFRSGDVTKGQLPGVMMQLKLGVWGVSDEGAPVVSHQCVAPTEWKSEMQRLRNELDELEVEGLKRFADYHRGMLQR